MQETKASAKDLKDHSIRWQRAGWQLHCNECAGQGSGRSGGVGIILRNGVSATCLSKKNTGITIPQSHRCGFWAVGGSHKGGYVVVVVYLHDSAGMDRANLDIVNGIFRVLAALGRAFVILGDWNVEPDELAATNLLTSISARIVATQDKTSHTPGRMAPLRPRRSTTPLCRITGTKEST